MFNVGLVLEGGGMRGMFTAGVLDFFLEKGIDFKEVIGVSAGACHGCSFVSKQHGRAKAVSVDYIGDKRYCSLYSLVKTGDLFGADFLYDEIPNKLNVFDHQTFLENSTKLWAVVTNVVSGEAEYIELEDMQTHIQVLRASASLPLLSRIVHFQGKDYLDGGIADSIPVRRMQANGLAKNVVILTQPVGYRKEKNGAMGLIKHKYRKYPKLIQQIANRHERYNETLAYIEEQEALGNVFVIRPQEKLLAGRIEKDVARLEALYQVGYEHGKQSYETLMKFLQQ
ncbi:MAG: patatin-like phospholipase family protein [Cellulosilyticaceae bacterium]